ncbi:hypothetical protein C0J50_15416 [Silurus asotus]|uniref:Gypsy retrotransposon integrase-like protein 1 n=1 Tax=Silurus asotus TaxID=30991 RepID=A0AAD5B062_SILAS|nr:hypothetical protein C0J50_15416 [Silurus asotus]
MTIVKVKGHATGDSEEIQGNTLADKVAKEAAKQPVDLDTAHISNIPDIDLKILQSQPTEKDIKYWASKQCKSDSAGIIRDVDDTSYHHMVGMMDRVLSLCTASLSTPKQVQILNPNFTSVTLRRNSKLADVSTCLAVEDLTIAQGLSRTYIDVPDSNAHDMALSSSPAQLLKDCGLTDIDTEGCEVSEVWKRKLADLVASYNDVFSKDRLNCGEAKDFVHRIHLFDEHPFRLPYRRIPPVHYQRLREVLSEMEEKGIISKSTSEYASPLVMVWKKNGNLRVCTDFHWLNAKTIKDAHPLPYQADCLAALGGNAFFSTMDLTSGFYNIPLHVSDRRYTAFTTPMGLYEYNRLPQGLCISPWSFMRMMLSIFGDLNFSSLLCYLDDLLVFAPSEQEALRRLEIVFSRLRSSNLKLAPKKCHFLKKSVKFLGHMIDSAGISVDEEEVKVISAFQKADLMKNNGITPSPKKLRSFLGMVLYYQTFIPQCSSIARPLFNLTAGQKRLVKGASGHKRAGTFRELKPQDWRPDCDVAFEELKRALVDSVVLAHPDFERPILLCTDASLDGLGAVLSQIPAGEDKARLIVFASKALSRSQSKYPAHRLEFLALKWAVCDKFSHWLKGYEFTVWTDNNPLTYIMTKPKLDFREQRWVSKLAPYSFEIKYVPGKLNVIADALSRDPFVRPADLREHQRKDPVIGRVLYYVDRKRRPSRRERANETVHQGQPRTVSLARQRFFWPNMERDVWDYVKKCPRCVLSKTPEPAARATLESIKTTTPLELVCIDFWSAEDRHNKSVDVLVITDHFTKLAHAFPCQDQTAKRVAKKLWDNFFCVYGFPQRIHSDQGATFESELFAELLELAGIDKSRTTPYYPMGNGGTERFNRTLGSMLRSLPSVSKLRWPQLVQTMTFVYNCTAHETTGFAPFYLMFGRVPRLPVDLMFQSVLRDKSVCDYDQYVRSLIDDLQTAMTLAQQHSILEQRHQSNQYNKRVKGLPLAIGDQMSDAAHSVGLIGQICTSESESTVHVDDEQYEATDLSQAECMSNISNVATCEDDRTASWVHSQMPDQQEPNAQVPVLVTGDGTEAGANHSSQTHVSSSVPHGQVLNTADHYTTRFGRVIKPVCRLIETMVQLESLLGLDSGSPVIHV